MKITNKIILGALLAPALLSLSSCGIYTKYHTPDNTALTAEYANARQAGPDQNAFGNLLWENVFTDPILAGYINQALANNTSLRNAQLNIDIAHAQLKGANLAFFPSLALSPNGAGSSVAGSKMSWTYALPLQASWEVDIFGKLRNSRKSAQAALYQSESYAQAVRSQIISGVATCYYSIASVKQQLKLYRNTSELWKESVEIMKNMKEAGRTTEAAVVQSTANYYSILAGITDLEVSLTQLQNTMSLLLNVMPQEWEVSENAQLAEPSFLTKGVSMECLAFRPDVAAAEMSLASAFYATNTARSNFYPSLTISAQGSFTNLLGSIIKNPGEWVYNLAGSLTAPLFSRGANISRLEAAKAQQQQALNTFEQTLLSAGKEVSDYLMTYDKAVEKTAFIELQVANLEKSVDYTHDIFVYGDGTYLEVITAQQSLLSAQMSELSNQLTRTQSIISLYQAMGGGR